MKPIEAIHEIPFRTRPLLEVLNLLEWRSAPDPDYVGFGCAWADEVIIENGQGRQRVLTDALVIMMHSADDGEVLADDVELEFVVDDIAADTSITVLLSDFLRVWLPRIRGDERHIVLAACNPNRARIAGSREAAGTTVHYALGDVTSWLDFEHRPASPYLVADEWRVAEPGG